MELGETVRSAQSEAEVVAVGRLRHHRRLAADWDRRSHGSGDWIDGDDRVAGERFSVAENNYVQALAIGDRTHSLRPER